MQIGYARVSTTDQDTRLQLDALAQAGVHRVFQDKSSGVGPRPNLHRALRSIRPGDTFVVWKLDRIARSLVDLLAIVETVGKAGASIRSLTEPIDTRTSIGHFTVQILGAVAELERNIIRERSVAGQQAAKARGVHIGRRRNLTPSQERKLLKLYDTGTHTMKSLADHFGVNVATVKRTIYRTTKPTSSSLK